MTVDAQMERSLRLSRENTPVCHVRYLFLRLLALACHREPLRRHTLLPPLPRCLGPRTPGVHLLLQGPLALLLGLGLMDVFNEGTLVLEGVTLTEMVKLMVKVLVDLASGTVLDKKTSENSETAHPHDLAGHTSILCTLPFTKTTMSANSSRLGQGTGTSTGVHRDRFADDEAIGNEFADSLAGVGV